MQTFEKLGDFWRVGGLLKSTPTSQECTHFSKPGGLSKTSLTSLEWKNFIHDKNEFMRVAETKFY